MSWWAIAPVCAAGLSEHRHEAFATGSGDRHDRRWTMPVFWRQPSARIIPDRGGRSPYWAGTRQIFRRLGPRSRSCTALTVRPGAREDADVGHHRRYHARRGHRPAPECVSGLGWRVHARCSGNARDETELSGSHILFATGRVPNTDALNLARWVLPPTSGVISRRTHSSKQTFRASGPWGDINRRGAFTHTAYHDHEIVLAHRDGLTDLHQWGRGCPRHNPCHVH